MSNSIIANTNSEKINIDKYIDTNLKTILDLNRNTALNTHAFIRNKPFLKHIKVKLEYPNVIPTSKNINVDDF
jgi:hypothetical protein